MDARCQSSCSSACSLVIGRSTAAPFARRGFGRCQVELDEVSLRESLPVRGVERDRLGEPPWYVRDAALASPLGVGRVERDRGDDREGTGDRGVHAEVPPVAPPAPPTRRTQLWTLASTARMP